MTAVKATYKGHGRPLEGLYYGCSSKGPREAGIWVAIWVGPARVTLTDEAGDVVISLGTAGKFWLAPVQAA